MNRQNLKYLGHCVLIILIQVLILNQININGMINPYIYPLLIILLPLTIRPHYLLILAFVIGFIIDIFRGTLGMHTSALVLIAFIRPLLFKLLNPKEQETNDLMDMYYHGITWFLVYIFIMILIHHLVFFLIEKGNFVSYHYTFFKTIISSAFSVLFIMMYLLFSSNKSSAKYS